MGEAEARGEVRIRGWLGIALLAILVTPAAALWLDFPERSPLVSRCTPGEGDWEAAAALTEAGEAATRGQPTVALRCAYQVFLDAEATGDAVAMVRVGDFLQNLGVPRYLKLSVRSAYLRAADHARRTQDWPVLAAVAIRLFAMGEREEAQALLLDVCSRTAAGGPEVWCDPARLAAIPTLRGDE